MNPNNLDPPDTYFSILLTCPACDGNEPDCELCIGSGEALIDDVRQYNKGRHEEHCDVD